MVMWALLGVLSVSNISLHMDKRGNETRMRRVVEGVRGASAPRGHDWAQARKDWTPGKREDARPQRSRPEGKKGKPKGK